MKGISTKETLLFSDFLREYRRKRRISQEQLAAELDKTQQTISRWESGRIVPPLETVPELARRLRVKQADLMAEIIESSLHRMNTTVASKPTRQSERTLDRRVEVLERKVGAFGRQLDDILEALEALRDQREG